MALSFARKEVVDLNGVWFAAESIAAATILGSVAGCLLTELKKRTHDLLLCTAAGVMLCAAVQSLLMPALEQSGALWGCIGIAGGAVLLRGMNAAAARGLRVDYDAPSLRGIMFVLAIAIHHLPEGLAAGVSFGTGEAAETASVCAAIALQNIPEVMMIMPAMSDYGRGKALLAAAVSGVVEIAGLLLGYGAVQLAVQVLPLLLAIAAGAMLYVIFEKMLPEGYENGSRSAATGILTGYCGMLLLSELVEYWM